jgi:hypothetical protein
MTFLSNPYNIHIYNYYTFQRYLIVQYLLRYNVLQFNILKPQTIDKSVLFVNFEIKELLCFLV